MCGRTCVDRVTWQLNRQPIHEDGWRVLVQQRNASLEIRNVELRDNGSYTCTVATIGFPPVVSAPVNLIVKGKKRDDVGGGSGGSDGGAKTNWKRRCLPRLTEMLKFAPVPIDKKLELGSHAKLSCKARGNTPPFVKWVKVCLGHLTSHFYRACDVIFDGSLTFYFRDLRYYAFLQCLLMIFLPFCLFPMCWLSSQVVQPPMKLPPHVRDENGVLFLEGVQHSDAGQYMCIATSPQGTINATITIYVTGEDVLAVLLGWILFAGGFSALFLGLGMNRRLSTVIVVFDISTKMFGMCGRCAVMVDRCLHSS